jgi:hypothetical protein
MFGKFTTPWEKLPDMGKQDRKLRTLELLVKCNLAVSKRVLFMNLKLRGATFERRSASTYVNELEDEGYVESIEISDRFTLYTSTDAGEKWFYEHDPTSLDPIGEGKDEQGGVNG